MGHCDTKTRQQTEHVNMQINSAAFPRNRGTEFVTCITVRCQSLPLCHRPSRRMRSHVNTELIIKPWQCRYYSTWPMFINIGAGVFRICYCQNFLDFWAKSVNIVQTVNWVAAQSWYGYKIYLCEFVVTSHF